jgi:hypothetical protein
VRRLLGIPLMVLRALVARRTDAGVPVGVCPACHTTVYDTDRSVRYHGDVWHLDPCVGFNPRRPAAIRYHQSR